MGGFGTLMLPGGSGGGDESESPLLKFVGFRNGFIPEFESRLMDGKGAMTPGPFIIYPTDGSKRPYYNTHEPGHVLQFWLLGPAAYTIDIIIPSFISAATLSTQDHLETPWEKSATTLSYWLTGESYPLNPHY